MYTASPALTWRNMKDDLVGKRFGKLVVISRHSTVQYTRDSGRVLYTKVKWNCVCDCGKSSVVMGSNLKGTTKGCSECTRSGTNAKPDTAFEDLWHHYQADARNRGHAWELSKEQFRALTQSPCYYTGILPAQVGKSAATVRRLKEGKEPLPGGVYIYNGIDRRDNNKGYSIENCVPCCKEANQMKMAFGHDEFIALCKEIAARH